MPSQMTIHRIKQPAECTLKLFHSTTMLLDLRKFHSSTRGVFGAHFVHGVNCEFFELIKFSWLHRFSGTKRPGRNDGESVLQPKSGAPHSDSVRSQRSQDTGRIQGSRYGVSCGVHERAQSDEDEENDGVQEQLRSQIQRVLPLPDDASLRQHVQRHGASGAGRHQGKR
ncbi:hypothetical protein CDAR_104551 [Caerostris darwini]|uniref:Uncharacterized protein n=1 Tax=Caerostris darwini TaxID=1538125 RepID=A0AAV4PR41_9ARAC|nr:hypothetical protein CDAR_104551 [Caerostris darwini]